MGQGRIEVLKNKTQKRTLACTLALAAAARAALAAVPDVTVHDTGPILCGIVSFTVAGVPCGEVRAALAARRPRPIRVHVSTAASTRIDFDARRLIEVVRASFHYYNEDGDPG